MVPLRNRESQVFGQFLAQVDGCPWASTPADILDIGFDARVKIRVLMGDISAGSILVDQSFHTAYLHVIVTISVRYTMASR